MQSEDTVSSDDSDSDNNVVWSEPDNDTLLELERRTDIVHEVCHKRKLLMQPINNKEFFVDHKHKLVWCNIFKAASSSWMYYFNILGKIFGACYSFELKSQIGCFFLYDDHPRLILLLRINHVYRVIPT